MSKSDTAAEMCLSKSWPHTWCELYLMGGWQLSTLCPASPGFFSHCQKTSHLLLSQCEKLMPSSWRLWWDLGNNCYSRLRMEMRMTSDWQNTLLGGLSYYPVSRSSCGERMTVCGEHVLYSNAAYHHVPNRLLCFRRKSLLQVKGSHPKHCVVYSF